METIRVGVAAFILKSAHESAVNPRFLVGKRINSHGTGTYAHPGGHLEFGETPERCATREVLEETGLHVSNVRFLTAVNDYLPDDDKQFVSLYMICERIYDGDLPRVLEPEKCEGWEWISREELKG